MNRIIHRRKWESTKMEGRSPPQRLHCVTGLWKWKGTESSPYKAPQQTDTQLARSLLYDARTSARNVKNYKYLSQCVNQELRMPTKQPLQGVCPAFSYDITVWPVGERMWCCVACTIALATQQCSGLYLLNRAASPIVLYSAVFLYR
jgi:hypothetical protein